MLACRRAGLPTALAAAATRRLAFQHGDGSRPCPPLRSGARRARRFGRMSMCRLADRAPPNVMPAKAGIQGRNDSMRRRFHHWIPAFAGMTSRGNVGRAMPAGPTIRRALPRHGRCERAATARVATDGDVEHRIDRRCPSYADHLVVRCRAGIPLRSGARQARRVGRMSVCRLADGLAAAATKRVAFHHGSASR